MAANNTKEILINNSSTHAFSNDVSMAAQTNESHVLIIEHDEERRELILDRPVYSIGRDSYCDICLINSLFVSRRHATLIRVPRDDNKHSYYYRIVDGDAKGKTSSNGLMINGRKILDGLMINGQSIPAHDLKDKDEIVFGPQVRAIYYLRRNNMPTGEETDSIEYDDITLIDPRMTTDIED